jgi:NDP-sugar pyrophosphorylase family protein
MSITTKATEAPPSPRATDPRQEPDPASLGAPESVHRQDRVEPIFDSMKLHRRDGQNCFRHINGGGLVALDASVEASVFVGENAAVLGHAVVRGEVRVEDRAVIADNASVSGHIRLRHESRVSGNAVLEGQVTMHRHSQVGENAHLRGYSRSTTTHMSGTSRGYLAPCSLSSQAAGNETSEPAPEWKEPHQRMLMSEPSICGEGSFHASLLPVRLHLERAVR